MLAFDARGLARAARTPRWWALENMRALAGAGKPLGYALGPKEDGPEWAFLACDMTAPPFRSARRSLVVLHTGTVIVFDFATPSPACCRQEVAVMPEAVHAVFTPGAGEPGVEKAGGTMTVTPGKRRPDALFLHVAQVGPALPVEPIWTIDLAGVQVGEWVVAFGADATMAHQPVFFDIDRGERLKILLTGLAPGSWDVWWKGWLEHPDLPVEPTASTLFFEGPPGGYYFRRRNSV